MLTFDETTGLLRLPPEAVQSAGPTNYKLPWHTWLQSTVAQDMGAVDADMQAAVAVLQMLHENKAAMREPVDILDNAKNCNSRCAFPKTES